MPKFSGADWLERSGKELSPFGRVVADVVGQAWRGIYHIERDARRADWSRGWVSITVGRELATFDGHELTALVVLCHDACVRLAVMPCNFSHLRLMFHQRQRPGTWAGDSHPTIERSVEWVREEYGRFEPMPDAISADDCEAA